MSSAASNQAATALRPHHYPLWLVAFTALVASALAYSMVLVPPYFNAYRSVRHAEAAQGAGNLAEAEAGFADVLRVFPSSKSTRIDLAVLLLATPDEANQRRGLRYLAGLTLGKSEWQRVSAVLPEKFQSLFSPVPKK